MDNTLQNEHAGRIASVFDALPLMCFDPSVLLDILDAIGCDVEKPGAPTSSTGSTDKDKERRRQTLYMFLGRRCQGSKNGEHLWNRKEGMYYSRHAETKPTEVATIEAYHAAVESAGTMAVDTIEEEAADLFGDHTHKLFDADAAEEDSRPGDEQALMDLEALAEMDEDGESERGGLDDNQFECTLCASVCEQPAFELSCKCTQLICSQCIDRHAANGAEMFKCPFCRSSIDGYRRLKRGYPAWVADDGLLLADDVEDDGVCYGKLSSRTL
jgi:hypothetical protein